jgi:hypothetical protein
LGYTTEFKGSFKFDKQVDENILKILNGLNITRRMKRDIKVIAQKVKMNLADAILKYGPEGELYFNENDFKDFGQSDDGSILDYNKPPNSQPGLWCQWKYDSDTNSLMWDGGEKFYNYTEWLDYLIEYVLKPNNYILNGEVSWQGQEYSDKGTIIVKDNKITIA